MKHRFSLKLREAVLFVLVSLALSVGIYREALWGKAMLAPLDLGPAFFQNYKFMAHDAGQVPENHYIIDQLTYDLPLQKTIYDSYRAGEIPWWDPYTYGGRPLLADAHINGTDPVRLFCYAFLPFEWAYNWNYALRGIITGLGLFLLLRYFKIDPLASIIFALTYQFGGWFTMFFGHPWIQAGFMYYPFLWLIWLKGLYRKAGLYDAIGGILCSLVIWSGNLQSHAYLPLFAVCFLSSLLLKDRPQMWRGLVIVSLSGITGALLAFPVLANQVEFFAHSVRSVDTASRGWLNPASILFSICSVHPWILGTFKTIDVSKVFSSGGHAFLLFCGGTVSILATLGFWSLRKRKGLVGIAVAQSFFMFALYIVVISTPLSKLLYPRMAGMAGMAIVLLGALGWQRWMSMGDLITAKKARLSLSIFSLALILSTLAIHAAYPYLKSKIESRIQQTGSAGASGLGTVALREAQIARFPYEATLLNPEALIGYISVVLLLSGLAFPNSKYQKKLMLGALLFGAIATISFHHRFRPKQDITLWTRLKEGGPLQKEAIKTLHGGLRLDESAVKSGDQIFPYAMATLYRVHVIHGYSALQPRSMMNVGQTGPSYSLSGKADYSWSPVDSFKRSQGSGLSRFYSLPSGESILTKTALETQNSISLKQNPDHGDTQTVRTDTFYSGWSVLTKPSIQIKKFGDCFSVWPEIGDSSITLLYRPSTSWLWPWCIFIGTCILLLLLLSEKRSSHLVNHT